jgi:hypothetical protein
MQKTVSIILSSGFISLAASAGISLEAKAAPAKCGSREKIIKVLEKDYNEVPLAMGLSQKSTEAFEIFTSEEGTWTVMMTMANGMTCIMAAGHSWENLPKKILGAKSL